MIYRRHFSSVLGSLLIEKRLVSDARMERLKHLAKRIGGARSRFLMYFEGIESGLHGRWRSAEYQSTCTL